MTERWPPPTRLSAAPRATKRTVARITCRDISRPVCAWLRYQRSRFCRPVADDLINQTLPTFLISVQSVGNTSTEGKHIHIPPSSPIVLNSTRCSDVLKRHSASCSSISPKRPTVPKNRACRRCAAHKRRCDYAQTCRNCVKSNTSCVYHIDPHEEVSRSSESTISLVQCDGMFNSLQLEPCLLLPVLGLNADPARSFPFLIEFTKDLSLPHSFESGTVVAWSSSAPHKPFSWSPVDVNLHEWSFLPLGDLPIAGQYAETITSFNTPYLTLDTPFLEESSILLPFESTISMNGGENWKDDPMTIKSFDIVQAIGLSINSLKYTNVYLYDSHSSAHTSCNNFFSAPQLHKFLDLYWKRWYPNWPTIHKPLFDPLQTPTLLMAAMAIIGACHSSEPQDREASNFWAEMVEELVFNELEMVKDETYEGHHRHMVKLLQAACIMVFYQNWNGTKKSKKRMRRQRFGTLVSVCSCLMKRFHHQMKSHSHIR